MAVFGLRVDKTSTFVPNGFSNRYFVLAATLSEAISHGLSIVDIEKTVFSELVTIVNVHAWALGVTPNSYDNQAVDIPGQVAADNGTPPEICAEITWAVPSTYPYYKRYRTHWDGANQVGLDWGATALGVLETAATAFLDLNLVLCTKTGTFLGTPSLVAAVKFEQMSKAWYNRA